MSRADAFGEAARWLLHDIRSPVQSLTLLSALLDDPDADVPGTLRGISDHMARSLELLSRVVHPADPLEPGPVSVMDAVEFIASLHQAARSRVRLETDVAPGLPAALGVDRHLEHALLNLVLYATDAVRTRDDGTIRISARAARGRVEITVTGHGVSMAPDLVPCLFDAPTDIRPAEQPTGLRLPVAREVVRLSGGTLTYSTEAGFGPGFLLSLPMWLPTSPDGSAGSS